MSWTISQINYARARLLEDECARRGIRLKRASAVEWVGPCPVCGGDDRFSINRRKQVWNCRVCDKGGDIIEFHRHVDGSSFGEVMELLTGETDTAPRAPVRPARGKDEAEEEERRHCAAQLRKALWLWKRCRPVAGTIAETYLARRGYHGPAPATLGFLPASGGYPPSMIAAFGLADEPDPGVIAISGGKITGIHLTRLLPDGSDRERGDDAKIMLGLSMGSPIVLAPPNDLNGMVITEGIEDALTVHQATGLGAWAAGSAGRMSALADTLPRYIECVTVCAHDDPAGRDGALALADALDRRGVEVFIEGIRP
jgi:phage/plasmid primase-like uncharacterized protein